jgi:hypothetical protein
MLQWHPMGYGVLEAWSHTDQTWAKAVARLETWPGEIRLTLRRAHTTPTVFEANLSFTGFTLDAAKVIAGVLVEQFPDTDRADPVPLPAEVIALWGPRPPRRCAFVHAWAPGGTDADPCACGRVTRGWAREHGLVGAS